MGNDINVNLIKNYLKENKMSKTKFCKLCGINFSTLNKILNNQKDFRVNALFKIAKVLNLQVYEISI